jgi:hypothetical protein
MAVIPVLNSAPRHIEVWGNGDLTSRILAPGTRWRMESTSYDRSFMPGKQVRSILLDGLIVFDSWSESGGEENVFFPRRKRIPGVQARTLYLLSYPDSRKWNSADSSQAFGNSECIKSRLILLPRDWESSLNTVQLLLFIIIIIIVIMAVQSFCWALALFKFLNLIHSR